MADFEDQRSAKPAPVNGLSDEAPGFDDSNVDQDPSHFSKFGDPHSNQFHPFSSQPSSTMAHKDYDQTSYDYGHYQDEADFSRTNEPGDYGHFRDDQDGDLPANFAREAARKHNFPEPGDFEDEPYGRDTSRGRKDETEELAQQGNGSNPFTTDTITKGNGVSNGSYVDSSDRPIMGYNPFLNEEPRYERDEEDSHDDRVGVSQEEEIDHFQGNDLGGPGETSGRSDEKEASPDYDRLEEDQDDDRTDLQTESVDNVQQYHEEDRDDRVDEAAEERPFEENKTEDAVHSHTSFLDDQIHSEDEGTFQQDESNLRKELTFAEIDALQCGPEDYSYDNREDQEEYEGGKDPHTPPTSIDYNKGGDYDEKRDDVENIPPQSRQVDEDDLGIVNQGFSDYGELEGGKIIPEEEEVLESEPPASKASTIIDTELYEERREENTEQEFVEEQEGVQSEEHAGEEDERFEDKEGRYSSERRDLDQVVPNQEDYTQEQFRPDDEEMEDGITQEEYAQEQLRHERTTEEDYGQEQIKRESPIDEDYGQEQIKRESPIDEDYGQEQIKRENPIDEDYGQEQITRESPTDEDYGQEQIKRESPTDEDYGQQGEEEEMEYAGSRLDDYTQEQFKSEEGQLDGVTTAEEEYKRGQFKTEETDRVTAEDYTAEQLSSDNEEMERATAAKGGHIQEPIRFDDEEVESVEEAGEKGFSSRFSESDVLSSEHDDRSFVDNLSEVTSPETIPQPLPSPPEPKNMSSFDPQAPGDSTSPCREPDRNLGQHGALFEHGLEPDENNTADFLTAGEIEGETKFGVDGTAVTSQNNSFLHSDDENDEEEDEEEESQHLDHGFTTTGTTETETSVDERSGEYGVQGVEQMEGNDNALMSMSMEGSFYDDGGELIGGEDKPKQQENHFYEGESIAEERSRHDSFEPKQEDYLLDRDDFGQQIQSDFAQVQESYQPQDDFDIRGNEDDLEPQHVDTAPPESEINGVHDEEDKPGGFDSLVDTRVTEQVSETPAAQQEEIVDSLLDITGVDSTANESESSVDSQPLQPHEVQSPKDLDDAVGDVHISEVPSEKPEEPASSVEETPAAGKEEPSSAAPEAAAATAAGVVVVAAAAAAAATTTKTTTTVKKSSAKPSGKTTTTTTTKVAKETKTATGKATVTKKSEITTTATSKTTPRKPTDSRPTSVATAEKKTPAKTITSPTKPSPAAPATAKGTGPVPSYAQPITPRKPKEVKATTTEEKKKPLTTTTTTTTSRTSSATHRAPRPQSATAATTTTTATATKATTRTSVTATTTTSRTATSLTRPKSSPTKLTNGTTAAPTDTKSPTKKYGIDSKNEGYKPTGGSTKAANEKKEVKASPKADAGSKSSTPAAAATKSPTKTPTTPRSSATPKSGDVRSKIGSLDNATHTPGGGNVRIASKKPDFTNVTSKVGSKDKMDHKPGGGNIKIESKKVKVEAKSKVGSLNNATHKPGGGDKKTESKKTSKIESSDKQGPGSGSEQGVAEVHNGAASEN